MPSEIAANGAFMVVIGEFKKFVMRGNVIDLAIGVIIGAAFGKIVTTLVDGILMPPIGYILSGMNVSHLGITLKEATETTPEIRIKLGHFLQALIDFLLIGLCLFALLKVINKIQEPEPEKPKETPDDIKLLTEIRDLLKDKTLDTAAEDDDSKAPSGNSKAKAKK